MLRLNSLLGCVLCLPPAFVCYGQQAEPVQITCDGRATLKSAVAGIEFRFQLIPKNCGANSPIQVYVRPSVMFAAGILTGTFPTAQTLDPISVKVGSGAAARYGVLVIRVDLRTTASVSSLPDGAVGKSYPDNVQFQTSGGGADANYSYTITPKDLGLTVTSDGKLSGSPVRIFDGRITIAAMDASGHSGQATVPLRVNLGISASPSELPDGAVGKDYAGKNVQIQVQGGASKYNYSIDPTDLGLTVSPEGKLSGPPKQAFDDWITIHATDTKNHSGQQRFRLKVNPGISASLSPLPGGVVGKDYPGGVQFQPLGIQGVMPHFSVSGPNSLPSGLNLSDDGKLSGPVNQTYKGKITIKMTAAGFTGTEQFDLGLYNPLNATTDQLSTAVASEPYMDNLAARVHAQGGRGDPVLTFKNAPPGLTVVGNLLQGRPTLAGDDDLIADVTDHSAPTPQSDPGHKLPIIVVTPPRYFQPDPRSLKPKIDALDMKLTSGADAQAFTKDVVNLAQELKHEFPKPGPLCLEPMPIPETVKAKMDLEGLKKNLIRVRTPANSKVFDLLIEAISRRTHLLTANQQSYCRGVWSGKCVSRSGVKFDVTLRGNNADDGWLWTVKEPFQLEFPNSTTTVAGGKWNFDFGKESRMTGGFKYYPKESEEWFEGTLVTRAYAPFPFSCSLKRFPQQGETPWD